MQLFYLRKFKNTPHVPFSTTSFLPKPHKLKKHFKTFFSFLTFSPFHFLSSCAWIAHHFGRITTSTSLGRRCLGCLPNSGPALRIPSHAQAQASGRC